jgi:undecaprenyl-diphosphatase
MPRPPRRARPDVRRWWKLSWPGRLERHELNWLIVGLGACILLFVFVRLAGEVLEGETMAFDTKILQALRSPDDPSRPIGPPWIENALLDLTAIGGTTVLTLVALAVVGFLLLQARYRTALVVLLATISGEFLNTVLKSAFNRPAPLDCAAPAHGVLHQLPERPRDGVGDRLPHARGDSDAAPPKAGSRRPTSSGSPCC